LSTTTGVVIAVLWLAAGLTKVSASLGYYGYETTGNRWLGAESRGYRRLIVITNDGSTQALDWLEHKAPAGARVVSYLNDLHLIRHLHEARQPSFELIEALREPDSVRLSSHLASAEFAVVRAVNEDDGPPPAIESGVRPAVRRRAGTRDRSRPGDLPDAGHRDLPQGDSMTAANTVPSHIPALDGLRGVAVLLVVQYHITIYGGFQPASLLERVVYVTSRAGWSGVDLFFVLSGFLITRILYASKGSEYFFRHFYIRRALRIFPLYYATLAVFFLAGPLVFPADESFQRLQSVQAWYWAYLVNVDASRRSC
jgi:hypothetical protein